MAHFKEWLAMSPIFRTEDFATWGLSGSLGTPQRANARWRQLLDAYEDPGINPAVDDELRDFVERRKRKRPPEEE